MLKKLVNLILLLGVASISWILNYKYSNDYLLKIFYSFISIATTYFFLKVILEGAVSKKIREAKTRYSIRKTTQLLFIIISGIIVLRIWIINPQALLVAYGLIAAGVAISLQDVFKNFAGALAISLGDVYRIGDRIEVGGKIGDVIDIGLFYTSLIELREWVGGDQTTGRITIVPNGLLLSSLSNNYTKDHSFIWDEIAIPITYESDWRKAVNLLEEITKKETSEIVATSEREISYLEEKYFLSKRSTEPKVFMSITDNWIMLNVRYVVGVRERRQVKNNLSMLFMDAIQKEKDISISSQTFMLTS